MILELKGVREPAALTCAKQRMDRLEIETARAQSGNSIAAWPPSILESPPRFASGGSVNPHQQLRMEKDNSVSCSEDQGQQSAFVEAFIRANTETLIRVSGKSSYMNVFNSAVGKEVNCSHTTLSKSSSWSKS